MFINHNYYEPIIFLATPIHRCDRSYHIEDIYQNHLKKPPSVLPINKSINNHPFFIISNNMKKEERRNKESKKKSQIKSNQSHPHLYLLLSHRGMFCSSFFHNAVYIDYRCYNKNVNWPPCLFFLLLLSSLLLLLFVVGRLNYFTTSCVPSPLLASF